VTTLSPEAFLAITAVAWADGLLRKNEAQGLLRAAKDCGLDAEALVRVEEAVEGGVDLASVDTDGLSGSERARTYAFAMWLAKIDGVVNTDELRALKALGDKLGLPEQKQKAAASAAFDVACLPGGNRPDKFDFQTLEARLVEKLPALMSG
jgi:uncharacterized membrane protein YebE (DUF533 family)